MWESIRSYLYHPNTNNSAQGSAPKRKREELSDNDKDDGDDDSDVVITAVKRPRQESSFFKLLTMPAAVMADWIHKRCSNFSRNFNHSSGMIDTTGGKSVLVSNMLHSPSNGEIADADDNYIPNFTCAGHRNSETHCLLRQPPLASKPTPAPEYVYMNGVNECTRPPLRRMSFGVLSRTGHPKFAAHECVRLAEKETYQYIIDQCRKQQSLKEEPSPRVQSPPRMTLMRSLSRSQDKEDKSLLGTRVKNFYQQTETSSLSRAQLELAASRHAIPFSSILDYQHQKPASQENWRQRRRVVEREAHHLGQSFVEKSPYSSSCVPISSSSPSRVSPPLSDDLSKKSPKSSSSLSPSFHKGSEWKSQADQYEDWCMFLTTKYSSQARQRKRQIEEAEIEAKLHEERRKSEDAHLAAQVRRHLQIITREPPVVEESEEEEEVEEEQKESLPELTEEMMSVIQWAFQSGPAEEVLAEGFRLQVKRRDIATLRGLNWLNDEVFNFYMNLLMERGEQTGRPKVYAFNTFFYPKLVDSGYSAVQRWTRRIDIFAVHYIVVPIHLGVHWCMAIINMKKKAIWYFDSMGGVNNQCLNVLKSYLSSESMNKKKIPFDLSGWTFECLKDIPQQMNGSDCGVFACKFADYVTREAAISFTQNDMPYFRIRMVYEIIKKKLLQ